MRANPLRPLLGRDDRPDEFAPLPPLAIEPIGWVRNSVRDPARHDWSGVRSRLVLRADLAPALAGLTGFSHVIVVCWLDRVSAAERRLLAVHPAGDERLPAVGVLGLRTHHRPNPLAVSVVPLLRLDGRIAEVQGLDVIDRTPVLDIKPYIPHYDSVPEARLPEWVR